MKGFISLVKNKTCALPTRGVSFDPMKTITPRQAVEANKRKKDKSGYVKYLIRGLECTRVEAIASLAQYNAEHPELLKLSAYQEPLPKLNGISEAKKKLEQLSDEEISEKTAEELDKIAADAKREAAIERLKQRDWAEKEAAAEKWFQFKAGQLDPFASVLANFKPSTLPRPIEPLTYGSFESDNEDEVFVVCVNDVHFGAFASAKTLNHGKDYNIAITEKIIADYAQKIIKDLSNRKKKIKKCVMLSVGDILHGLRGMTEKGTILLADSGGLREDQLEIASRSMGAFIGTIASLFDSLDIHVVKGNHAGMDEYHMFHGLSLLYNERHFPNIKFNLVRSLYTEFNINHTFIHLTHGAAETIKFKVPTGVKARELYFAQHVGQGALGTKEKLVIAADLHHYEYKKYTKFDYLLLPSPVLGDLYADQLGYRSRAQQVCFVINDDGVKEQLLYTFD